MIRIISDLYDIARRLKEIDSGYQVFYDPCNKKYQLHREYRGKVEYQLTFPFDSLDARCVTHCLKTRVERAKNLLEEIEKENYINEKNQLYQARKKAENMAEQSFNKALKKELGG